MLIIQRDPTGASGKEIYELDTNISLQDNIEKRLNGGADVSLWLNGVLIADPANCEELDRTATVFDDLRIQLRPEGVEILVAVAISLAVSAASYFLLPKPSIPNDMGAGKDSPNNRLTGQTNLARLYQAIPDIYGRVRSYPDLIQQSVVEYVNHVKQVTEWVCIGRGKYLVQEVKYAETPLSQISGSSYEVFYPVGGTYPEQGITTVSDIYESFETPDVNGQELIPAVPSDEQIDNIARDCEFTNGSKLFTVKVPADPRWDQLIQLFPNNGNALIYIKSSTSPAPPNTVLVDNEICACKTYTNIGGFYTFTFEKAANFTLPTQIYQSNDLRITPQKTIYYPSSTFTLPTKANQIRWNTVFLRGLKGTVQIKTTWYAVDSGGVEIGGSRQSQTDTYSADTYDSRYYTKTVIPSYGTGSYRVFFERLTEDLENGSDVAKIEELYALNYYQTKTFIGVTIMRLTTIATEQATGGQDRKFNLMATRYVRDIYSSVVAPSRNFARAIVHQFVAVAGRDESKLDLAALLICQGQAGEPNGYFDFTFDDKDVSLGARLQTIANAARVQVFREGNVYSFVRDQNNGGIPVVQFDYRNLAANGESSINYRGHLPTSFDSVELEYVNPTDNKKALVNLRINPDGTITQGIGARTSKIQLAGCRDLAQATNRAYFEAAKILYQRESVSDVALQDAALVGIGEVVRWVDPNDFFGDDGLQAGEVLAIDGTVVTTSEPIHWGNNTTGRVIFTNGSGASLSPVIITPRTDNKNGFVAASIPSGVYLSDGSSIQLGSRYSVGVGLDQNAILKAGLYIVTSKKPSNNGTIAIELINYDSRVYQYD